MFKSSEIVGRVVDVTVDSMAVRREVTDRPAKTSQNRQPHKSMIAARLGKT